MNYLFQDEDTKKAYLKFLERMAPRFSEIKVFCETPTSDNLHSLKKRLLEYEAHNNFLSFHYGEAMTFYKKALAQEWDKEGDFKGSEERKVRSAVEARCIEPEAVLEQFERLIKGLATSLTAIQTNLRVEETLLSRRME